MMKKIQKEKVIYNTVYEALDGTEFNTIEECEAYEASARCILNAKYVNLVIDSKSEYEIFNCGSEDCYIDLVKFNTEKDIDIVLQFWAFNNSCNNHSEDPERINRQYVICKKALDDNDILFIYRGYDNDSFCIECTRNQMIEHLNNLDNNTSSMKE